MRLPTKAPGIPPWTLDHQHYPDDNEQHYLIQVEDRCCGYAITADMVDEIWIFELSVHPAYRGSGMATTLLQTVLSRHSDRAVGLSCTPFQPSRWPPADGTYQGMNPSALADWYHRHGFRRARHRPEYNCMVRYPTQPAQQHNYYDTHVPPRKYRQPRPAALRIELHPFSTTDTGRQ
ncbi:N-acetyltransferase [Nocardia sp. XZ_19_369]|uniref:GNAT family N-acetyltransferase n=1 Tax=Nocardia sp. XZ_19_369 TaxID=2769487 RepID=UPI00188E5C13|nr:GNAT family N-acetyltransferase [Nocardia sp. XZ_19_369]